MEQMSSPSLTRKKWEVFEIKERYVCQFHFQSFTDIDLRLRTHLVAPDADPSSTFMLMLSPNDTVTDLASTLRLADSLLRLARLLCSVGLVDISACTSSLQTQTIIKHETMETNAINKYSK